MSGIIELRDEDLSRAGATSSDSSMASLPRLEEIGKEPESIFRALRAQLKRIDKQKGIVLSGKLLEGFFLIFHKLDETLDSHDKAEISAYVAKSLSDHELETLEWITTKNPTASSSDGLLNRIMKEFSVEALDDPAERKDHQEFKAEAQGRVGGLAEKSSRDSGLDAVMAPDAEEQQAKREKDKAAKEAKARKTARLKKGLSRILKGDREAFFDTELMEALPDLLGQLLLEGKYDIPNRIIHRLGEALLSTEPDMRFQVSKTLSNIIGKVPPERRLGVVKALSGNLTAWLQFETSLTSSYKRVCKRLKDLVQWQLRTYQFDECIPILEDLRNIHTGAVETVPTLHDCVSDIFRRIPSDDILDLLLKECRTNENNKRKSASRCLTRLDLSAAARVLDVLRRCEDKAEHARLIQVVSDMGPPVVSALKKKIEFGGAPPYLCDLILLLGRVGSEADLPILERYLTHDDPSVRKEALKSVYNIRGERRGEVLSTFLPSADDGLKLEIVRMLGCLKCQTAVQPLVKLLKSKPFFSSEDRDELEEAICAALGGIGSEEAVDALKSICSKKTFWSTKPFSKNVQSAAKKALEQIHAK